MRSLFLLLAFLAGPTTAGPKRDAMTRQGFLQVADDAFWTPNLDLGPHLDLLIMRGAEALALDAPRAADLRTRATLPAAILTVASAKTALRWNYREHLLLVACETERFECRADRACPVERPVQRPRGPVGAGDGGVGGVANQAIIDVRRRIQLPWEPGVWQLLLVTRDRRSEPARVVLHSGGALPPAPVPLPGAQLELTASGKGLDTDLALTLKARASRAVLGAGQTGDEVAVPVTLVVTGHDRPAPYVVRRAVQGRWGPAGEPEHVVASARVPLKDLVPASVQDSALYVWAFAGDQVSTPVRVALP